MSREHVVGLLLGTEDDWPTAYEEIVRRAGPLKWKGETHTLHTERIMNEPFDLRYKPRYRLVIDRLSWWYDLPRAWLKKISLMDDVYLLNNPFTFQAMEKHSAYVAMMRLGLKVPDTWLIPHKAPPGGSSWTVAAALERFPEMAARYNAPFDLAEIGRRVGYPLFMKPFDGGMWVGVSQVRNDAELQSAYDGSGERMMHLQQAVDGFDVFTRTLTIGAESMVMQYDPSQPLHGRYQIAHDFLTPELGYEVVTISKLVNAFFRWEMNSAETLVKGEGAHPIDYANASPDVALTSLHYYWPWAIESLVRWTAFCCATGRPMRIGQNIADYFEIGDRGDLTYEEKLREYRRLADEYHQAELYEEFVAEALPHVHELVFEYIQSPAFDDLLVTTVQRTFPAHEHEAFTEHYRGIMAAWARDQQKP